MGKLLGATHSKVDTKYKEIISKLPRMLRRRSSNVYCPHNGVLCREEDLTLSAVCSTCAQAHLAQIHLVQDQLDQGRGWLLQLHHLVIVLLHVLQHHVELLEEVEVEENGDFYATLARRCPSSRSRRG